MRKDRDYSWLSTFKREAGYRRCIIMYGNVRDLWYDTGTSKYLRLSQYLNMNMKDFTTRARWDRLEGFNFPTKGQLRRFREALERQVSATSEEGEEYNLEEENETSNTGRTTDNNEFRSGGFGGNEIRGSESYAKPEEAFSAIRSILSSEHERGLFILDWSEHMLSTANQQDLDEREMLINLAKGVTDQPFGQLTGTAMGRPTGLLVIITSSLGALPPKFYNYDNRIKLLSIPSPDIDDRREMIFRHQEDVIVKVSEKEGTYQDSAAACKLLAEMTDGMSFVDIRNILSLLIQSKSPMTIESLMNLYKFGERDSPWEKLDEEKISKAKEIITQRVKGQEEAVDHVCTMIIRAFLGLSGIQHSSRMSKPKGTLFFVGPTGVGKTELAKSIAEFIFGDENNCLRFDMSEFSQEHADQRLIGAPPGYVGFEEGGQLTNAVAEKPFSVLLFDEIEKAHPRVLDKFLQILEDGRLTDGRGQTVHFSETVLIFTSNIGANKVKEKRKNELKAHFLDAVREHFNEKLGRPELLNRFGDNIIVFNLIDDPEIRKQIVLSKLEGVHKHLKDKFDIELELANDVIESFITLGDVSHGGRGLINVIERNLINPLSSWIFERLHMIRELGSKTVRVNMKDDRCHFQFND